MEGVAINPTIELPELTEDWENRLLEGTNRTLCTTEPEERSSDPTRDWPRLAVSVQESPVEAWVSGGLLEGWGH